MEVDIAPQFGAELKVRDTPVLCRGASTDTDNSPGWLQERQCLGMAHYLPIYCYSAGATLPASFRPRFYAHMLIGGTSGLRRHRLAGRHPAILPRKKRHREGLFCEAQRSGKEIFRKEG